MEQAGQLRVGIVLLDEDADGGFIVGQLRVLAQGTLGTAKGDALTAAEVERLPRPLGDHLTLDLGGKGKGKGEDFGLEIVTEVKAVLDGVDADALAHAEGEDGHDHKQAAAKAGNLGTEDGVSRLDMAEKLPQLALVRGFGAGDGFLDPAVYVKAVCFTVIEDDMALIFQGLLVGRDADIAVNHSNLSFLS